jgi:hypothetical protein
VDNAVVVRFAAVALAVLPAAAAWALCRSGEYPVVAALGAVAVAGGLWTLSQPLPKHLRLGAAAVALLTLPATTGLVMARIPGRFTPYKWSLQQADLAFLTLPLASEAVFDPFQPARLIVNVDRWGGPRCKGSAVTLRELDEIAAREPDTPLLLRLDKDLPYLHLSWLLDLARTAGYREVRLAAQRFGDGRHREELDLLAASDEHPDWPESELRLALDADVVGDTLRIEGSRRIPCLIGVEGRKGERVVEVRYSLGDRHSPEILDAARWTRRERIGTIAPVADVPVKFVIAILNECAKRGRPLPQLVRTRSPTAAERNVRHLPFPRAG